MMRRDGTPDEFDRDREEFEDRQQLAKQALDLRAVEARLLTVNEDDRQVTLEDAEALLAHCRALRAALREALTLSPTHPFFPNSHAIHERAAAVLAQATDEAGSA